MKHLLRSRGPEALPRRSRFPMKPLAAAVAAACVAAGGSTWAQLPGGANVVHGSAGIVTQGNAMTITNSPGAVVNWQNFSIGAQNSVRFQQQSQASQVLNRVVGNDPSNILGSLSSNGRVWLVNPHGVLFGKDARIDVAGLVASTLGISNEDFLRNRNRFESAGPSGAQVLNQGAISTTFGGRVWLMGDSVRNEGLVQTPGGQIVLAAGKSIERVDSGMPHVTVRVTAPENEAVNLGSLIASTSGSVDVHGGIVNQRGIVRADSLGTDAAGRVVIRAQGDTLVSGEVSAASASGKGGQVHLLGGNVGLVGQASVNASGGSGGGEILVGGDYLGANADVPNARASYVGAEARLQASATSAGDGGRVIVWSDKATRVYGAIEARGKGHEGRGGFVETSGGYLDARPTRVDVGSDARQGGTWLLDPNNITIGATPSNATVAGTSDGIFVTSNADNSVVAASTLVNALNAGSNVHVVTGTAGTNSQPGHITVASSINKTTNNAAALLLAAHGDITINSGVSISSTTPTALDVTLLSNIAGSTPLGGGEFPPQPSIIRFPPADNIGGIVINGSITANNISIDAAGVTPFGNHVNMPNATLTGSNLRLRAGTWVGSEFFLPGNSVAFLGNSNLSMSDTMRISAGTISGTPVGSAGNWIHLLGSSVLGGTWTNPTDTFGRPAILLDATTVSGVTLNTPFSRWVVRSSGSPDTIALTPSYVRVNQPSVGGDPTTAQLGPDTAAAGVHGFVLSSPLNATVRVNASRPYDGTTAAQVSSGQVLPAIAGWTGLAATNTSGEPIAGNFNNRNAGVDKPVALPTAVVGSETIYPFALTYRNAPVRGASQQYRADITPRPVSAAISAADKVYDGNASAVITVGPLSNIVSGDSVSVSGAAGAFNDRNVGTAKPVSIVAGTLTGADAGNYQLVASGSTTASITPRPVALTGVTAADKVYDGTRTATVSGTLTNLVPGDAVSLAGVSGLFDDKNVGTGKPVAISGGVLGGPDGGNYVLTSAPSSASASITHRPIGIAIAAPVVREYDATSAASLTPGHYALTGAIAGDAITVSGPAQGSYDSPNVGTLKPVSATGAFEVAGADAANYSVGAINLTGATNVVNATASGNVGTITPATLTYVADPAVRTIGLPITGLSGSVTGFRGADSPASSTSGSLAFTTPATETSPPGRYGVNGSGLSAPNYVFTQAPGNATALAVIPANTPDAPQQQAAEGSTQAIDAALSSVVAALTPRGPGGAVFDLSNPALNRFFGPIKIGSMSQDELARLLEARKDFKRKLFADAIYKLEIDPSLADVQPCPTLEEAARGACRITPAQLDEAQSKRPAAPAARAEAPGTPARARPVALPQIERKFAVLFGVNDYADKKIPRLENAIPDVDAVAKLFAERLGYEVRVLRNPGKADIIRSLNQLATEVGPSDSVVVYYAGHGYSLDKNGAGYWLPTDAGVNSPTGWVSNNDVAKLLAGLRSKQMAVISDSCYSGAFARDGTGLVGRNVSAEDVLTKRSVVVLSSGGDEPVSDEGKDGHSIFAWNLMRAIRGVDNWRPGTTIFEQVAVEVRKEFPQSPKYGSVTSAGHQPGGDYLFEER